MRKFQGLSALLEIITGLGLLLDPGLVLMLLLGEPGAGLALVLARLAGIALLSLGLACWPGAPSLRGILVYNVLATLFLAYLGFGLHLGGKFLWPAVALHFGLSLALLKTAAD